MRTLVRKLRDPPHRVTQFRALQHYRLIVVARQHCFVVRELPGKDPRNQQPVAHLEEQVAFVFRKVHLRIRACGARKFFHFVHRLLGNQHFYFAIQSSQLVVCFRKRQPVTVRRHHRKRVRLQNQQAPV